MTERKFEYDLFVIGAGSGGVRAARIAGGLGARVGVAESGRLGGTCVNVGCVPKKLMTYAARFGHEIRHASYYGWSLKAEGPDLGRFMARKDNEIERLNTVYEGLLNRAGVEVHFGKARFLDAHTLEVAGSTITAESILVATGGWPVLPDIPGIDLALNSNDVFEMKAVPPRVVVVGGGYIGLEFASIFKGLGSEVTLLHRGEKLLRGFDEGVCEVIEEQLGVSGIEVRLQTEITELARASEAVKRATLADGSTIHAEAFIFATGRVPNTRSIGLEAVGVELDDVGTVLVDDNFQTSVPHIYAVGDVKERENLTPVALAEGQAVAQALFGEQAAQMVYDNIPTAVFSRPPVATVGLTEARARERYGAITVFETRFRPLKHTLTSVPRRVFMKLIVDTESDKVVGCHMVGEDAPEIMQGIAIALTAGATKRQFDATIGIHPTAAEEFVTMRTPRASP